MHPYLYEGIASYGVFLLLADVLGVVIAIARAKRSGLTPTLFAPILIICNFSALAGAKVYSVIERGGAFYPDGGPATSLAQELVYGYRFPGGIVGLLLGIVACVKLFPIRVSLASLADLFAPCFACALAVVRVGCLLAGCCSGVPTSLPFGIRFPAHTKAWALQVRDGLISSKSLFTVPVHPLQIYFSFLAIGVGVLLAYVEPRKKFEGQLALMFVAMYCGGTALLEPLRYEPAPQLRWLAMLMSLLAIVVLAVRVPATKRVVVRDLPRF